MEEAKTLGLHSWARMCVCVRTDFSLMGSLSVSTPARTRKMVSYALWKANPGETLMGACSGTDVQIVRYTWVWG